jgi:hypothetical protein
MGISSDLQAGRPPLVEPEIAKIAAPPKALESGEVGIAKRGAAALAAVRSGARPAKPMSAIRAKGFGGFGWRTSTLEIQASTLTPYVLQSA